jgi:predicted transcriptional regulator
LINSGENMTLRELMVILDAEVIVGETRLDIEVNAGFAADLMSDVLSFAKPGAILLTGLTNPLVVRTADTMDLIAIVFVRGKKPLNEAIELAKQKNIPLLATRYIMFESCGRLYKAGIRGSITKTG